jgi:hypothetical protein
VTTTSTRELEVIAPIPHLFSSVFESRSFLENEINSILGYLRQLRDTDHYAFLDMLAMYQIRRALDPAVVYCHNGDSNLPFSPKGVGSVFSSRISPTIPYILVTILETMISESEMTFDEYTSKFEQIIALAESLVIKSDADNPPVLPFGTNGIPQLLFLALKCRVIRLRRQAVALLKQASKQEGLWRRESTIKMCNWKKMMEEQGRGKLSEVDMLPKSTMIYREHISEQKGWGRPPAQYLPQIMYKQGTSWKLEIRGYPR